MPHPNDFETTTAPARGDGAESSLRKINRLIAEGAPVLAKQFSAAPDTAAIETSSGDVFTLSAGQKGLIINLGTNPLYVRRATGATSSAFHYVLAAGSANDDGTGAAVEIDDHVGVVSVAGTSPRFLAWKVST